MSLLYCWTIIPVSRHLHLCSNMFQANELMVQSTFVYRHLFQVQIILAPPHSYRLPPRPLWITLSWCVSMDWIPVGSIRSVTSPRTRWSGQESVCVWRGTWWGQITSVFPVPVPPQWVHTHRYIHCKHGKYLECTFMIKTSLTSINLIGFESVLVRITVSLLLYISVYCNKHFGQKAAYAKSRTNWNALLH